MKMMLMKRLTNSPLGEATIAFYWSIYLGMLLTHTVITVHSTYMLFDIIRYCALLSAAPAYLCAYSRRQLLPPDETAAVQRLGCKEHRQALVPVNAPTKFSRAVTAATWVPVLSFPLAVVLANGSGATRIVGFVVLYSGWAAAAPMTLTVAFSKARGKQKLWLLVRALPLAVAVPLTNSMPLPP